MKRCMSTLDILRTNVNNGEFDERLLHLLRIKTLRNIETLLTSKVCTQFTVLRARGWGKSIILYGNKMIKDAINIEIGIGLEIFKRRLLKAYSNSMYKEYADEYKNGNKTFGEYKEKVKYYESLYKQSKKLKKIVKYILDKIVSDTVVKDKVDLKITNPATDMFNIINHDIAFLTKHNGGIIYIGDGYRSRHIEGEEGIVIIRCKDTQTTPWFMSPNYEIPKKDPAPSVGTVTIVDNVICIDKLSEDCKRNFKKINSLKQNKSYLEMNKKYNRGRR